MVSVAFEERESAARASQPVLRPVLLLVFTLAASLAVTFAYSGVFLHTLKPLRLPVEYRIHLALILSCLCLVLMFALRAHGGLDRKLTATAVVNALVHGVLAFLILGGRWYFSRPILLTNFVMSLVLGLGIVLLKHRIGSPRVALVRPLALDITSDITSSRIDGDVISSPRVDLTTYDTILVSFTGTISAEWARALSRAMLAGCQVRHVGEYVEDVRGAVSLEHFELEHLAGGGVVSYRPIKRFIDVATVVFFTPAVATLTLLAALAVLITMGWPVFFVQERVGLAGKPFRMWKLRTMLPPRDGEADRAAVPGDRRVTRVGGFLRRFRIDELPQTWNVLRGEMSLIGPRPEAVAFHDEYLREVPEYAYRNLVRPGISGWAQVCAPPSANATEARRKLMYDLYYVKRMSMFLDLQIALRTIWTVTHGGGVR